MKLLPILLIALALAACGKKEQAQEPVQPTQQAIEQTADKNAGCMIVTILNVEDNTTYMDVDGTALPHARVARSGHWGAVGDRFRYCE